MHRRFGFFIVAWNCFSSLAHSEQIDDRLETTITKQVGLHYRTVTPEDYDPEKKYPLLIFLHGRGEQGDNLNHVQIHGPFKKVAELRLPFLIVAPQSPKDERWQADSLSALVDHLLKTLPVDKSRVYLTGLSMGGEGTYVLATHRPEVFAAIAPVCGWSSPSKASQLQKVPTWIFHGAKDTVVHFGESTRMAEALYQVGNDARLTIYPHTGHNAWDKAYANPKLYEWMLSKRRGPR